MPSAYPKQLIFNISTQQLIFKHGSFPDKFFKGAYAAGLEGSKLLWQWTRPEKHGCPAWMPSCLAGGGGGRETSKAGGKVSPPPQRRAAELGLRGRGNSLSYNHFKYTPGAQPPSKCWQSSLWSSKSFASTGKKCLGLNSGARVLLLPHLFRGQTSRCLWSKTLPFLSPVRTGWLSTLRC